MNKNLMGRVLIVGALVFAAACQSPAPAPAAGSGSGAATAPAEGTAAAAAGSAEGTGAAAEASAAPAEGTAAPAAGSAAAPAAGSGAAAAPALPAPHPVTGEPVAAATAENLHGTWVADMAALMAQEAANMPPEQVAMMQALMGSMQITFTFNADGTAVMAQNAMGQSETKNGTYTVGGAAANTVTFTLTEVPGEGSAAEPAQTFTATFQSTNNMSLAMEGDPQVIPFYRQ